MDSDRTDPPPPPAPQALYTNYLQAGSTEREIILEFGQFHRGDEFPTIHTRLVSHPAYVEEFLKVLAETLQQCRERPGSQPPSKGEIQ